MSIPVPNLRNILFRLGFAVPKSKTVPAFPFVRYPGKLAAVVIAAVGINADMADAEVVLQVLRNGFNIPNHVTADARRQLASRLDFRSNRMGV